MTRRRRKTLDDEGVKALKVKAARYAEPDPEMLGHYIRVGSSGKKTSVVVARDPNGKQVWETVGDLSLLKIAEAREKARQVIQNIQGGSDRVGPQSFQQVYENWLKRYVEQKGLRSADNIKAYFKKHVLDHWGGREFTSIHRGDVAKLLDGIEDSAGPVAADKVLAHISKLCRWYQSRSRDYVSPVVSDMRRSNPTERARKRILNDNELRTVWKAAEANGAFGAFVRLSLLTAQRREKVAAMRWQDIAIDGTWSIPAEKREKGNAGELVLPEIALDIIKAQSRIIDNPYVFAAHGGSYRTG